MLQRLMISAAASVVLMGGAAQATTIEFTATVSEGFGINPFGTLGVNVGDTVSGSLSFEPAGLSPIDGNDGGTFQNVLLPYTSFTMHVGSETFTGGEAIDNSNRILVQDSFDGYSVDLVDAFSRSATGSASGIDVAYMYFQAYSYQSDIGDITNEPNIINEPTGFTDGYDFLTAALMSSPPAQFA